jgi:hypothetical protein
MDNSFLNTTRRFLKLVSKRTKTLFSNHPITQSTDSSPITIGFWFLISITLGFYSFQKTKSILLENFEKKHSPQPIFWKAILAQEGLTWINPKTDTKLYETLLRRLPTRYSTHGTNWVNANPPAVSIATPSTEPMLFLLGNPVPNKEINIATWNWQPVLNRWDQMDMIQRMIQENVKNYKKPSKTPIKKKRIIYNPYEIIY